MSNKNEIVVQDACILIDLVDLDIIDDFHLLGLVVFTSKAVIEEITDEEQYGRISICIEKGLLLIDTEGDDEVTLSMFDEITGLSLADCSVLEFAIRKQCAILSSDKRLRNECNKRSLEVRGILWIIEELYIRKIITHEFALERLKIYPEVNDRAPKGEIEKLISKLSGL
ncbi:MAG: hypothetical protein K1X63_05420 [Chitinophagales bacterium]|nr:hypothetical protein [Chitinophagales bacterium]